MKNKNSIIVALVVIIVAAGAFFAGTQYQKSQRPQFGTFNGQDGGQARFGQGGQGQAGARRFGGNGGAVMGDIISTDDKSITVKLPDGSSKIVLVSSNTSINKADKATQSDLKSGLKVAVFGTPNSDGSVTAASIQLNPVMRMNMQPSVTPQK